MHFALVADVFPPLRSSGAVQLRDLARAFVQEGHELTVILPSSNLEKKWSLESINGAKILRLRSPKTKDIGYLRRTIGEFLMPLAMSRNLRKSPLGEQSWDGIIWYSPSIFHGPLISRLKRSSNCPSYLVIRDIFPEWAADMGLLGRGLPYRFLQAVAHYQYTVADVIGVQTHGSLVYFKDWEKQAGRKLEVLQNWLGPVAECPCSIDIGLTTLAGRKIFVYAGNMGVAQGMGILLDLAERLRVRSDIGFLFVGRGSDAKRLSLEAKARQLDNVAFFDEIDPDEIPGLYAQCHVGLVALDSRHRSHNIPGKFLTYMQSALPVLANINEGNDLARLIRDEMVGKVSEVNSVDTLERLALELLDTIGDDVELPLRCKALFKRLFSADDAARQIAAALGEIRGGIAKA